MNSRYTKPTIIILIILAGAIIYIKNIENSAKSDIEFTFDASNEQAIQNEQNPASSGSAETLEKVGTQPTKYTNVTSEPNTQNHQAYSDTPSTPLTPKQIGNRPSELSHIVSTYPPFDGSYINRYEISPGFVPKLFRAAGFREGDILKAVNGIDISDPLDFERAQASLADADTITFSIIRDGQPLTLFLDIPSEELKISS